MIASIYIKRFVRPFVRCPLLFVPGGQTICLSPGGQTFLTHRWGGGQTNCLSPGDKHFSHTGGGDKQIVCPRGTNISHTELGGGTNNLFVPGGQTFLTHSWGRGGQTFSYDQDNDRECERSEHSFERSEEAPCRG